VVFPRPSPRKEASGGFASSSLRSAVVGRLLSSNANGAEVGTHARTLGSPYIACPRTRRTWGAGQGLARFFAVPNEMRATQSERPSRIPSRLAARRRMLAPNPQPRSDGGAARTGEASPPPAAPRARTSLRVPGKRSDWLLSNEEGDGELGKRVRTNTRWRLVGLSYPT